MMVVAVLAAAWILAPSEPEPIEEPPARRRLLEALAEVEPLEAPLPVPAKPPRRTKAREQVRPQAPDHLTRGALDRRTSIALPPVTDQVRRVLDAPLEVPEHIDDPDLAQNRAHYRRRQDLEKLEGSLLNRLKRDPDPYQKFELQVALAEVYQAEVGNLEQFRVPPAWGDVRADRWLGKLDEDIAIARDKARMLLDISQKEAGRWPADDPAVQQLNRLR